MTHKSTFKANKVDQPWHRRLTKLAWVLIGVGVVMISGWATPSPAPTPTAVPSNTPEPTSTQASTPTPMFWWGELMTEDSEGHLLPPQEVQDQVWDAFIGGLGCSYLVDREEPPEDSVETLVREAAQYLTDDPNVWMAACSGGSNFEQATGAGKGFLLVSYRPRFPTMCDESPTRCQTAVTAEVKGTIVSDDELCQIYADGESPCIVRMPTFSPPYISVHYLGTLEYNEGDGTWQIVH